MHIVYTMGNTGKGIHIDESLVKDNNGVMNLCSPNT